MQVIIILFLVLFSIEAQAQKTECRKYSDAMKSGDTFFVRKDYDKALIEYMAAQVAARECGLQTKEPADKLKEVFGIIKQLYNDATKAQKEVEKQKRKVERISIEAIANIREAEIKGKDASALLMTSDAAKLIPIQEMRLLEKAYNTTMSSAPKMVIKEKILENFKNSRIHQYRNVASMIGFSKIKFSPDSKWLITVDKREGAKIIELETQKENSFLNITDQITSVDFSSDSKWTLIKTYSGWGDLFEQLFEFPSGKIHAFLNEDSFDPIKYITFSPDGKWVETRSFGYVPEVWELATGKKLDILKEDKENIRSLLFSENDQYIAVLKNDSSAKVWELPSGKYLDFLKKEKDIKYITFSPKGRYLITEHPDSVYKMWEVSSGKYNKTFEEGQNINSFKFSPDEKWLVVIDNNYNHQLLQLPSGLPVDFLTEGTRFEFSKDGRWLAEISEVSSSQLWELSSHKQFDFKNKDIAEITFSPDSRWAITKDIGGLAAIWNLSTGRQADFFDGTDIGPFSFSQNSKWLITQSKIYGNNALVWELSTGRHYTFLQTERYFRSVEFSPDEKWMLTSNTDDFYDESDAKLWKMPVDDHDELLAQGNIVDLNISPDSNYVYTQSKISDTIATIWTIPTGKQVEFLLPEGRIRNINFSQDKKWMITTNDTGLVKVWGLPGGKSCTFFVPEKTIESISFSPDGNWMTAITTNKKIRIWNVPLGKEYDFAKEENDIKLAYISPDSKWIIIKKEDSTLTAWELTAGKFHNFLCKENRIEEVTFSPDGRWMVLKHYADYRDWREIWDLSTGAKASFVIKDYLKSVAFSPDCRWMVVNPDRGNFKIYKLPSGEPVDFIKNEIFYVDDILFSPDSTLMITKSEYYDASQIWDLTKGKQKKILQNEAELLSINFSPNGKWMATLNRDSMTTLWELSSGKRNDLLKHEKNIRSVYFSRRGNWLVTLSSAHTVTCWNIQSGKPITTVWLNQMPWSWDIAITNERWLYILTGNTLLKLDLENPKEKIFKYGDGNSLDYTFEEIQEWLKIFGDTYLLPLDEKLKKKYDIKDK